MKKSKADDKDEEAAASSSENEDSDHDSDSQRQQSKAAESDPDGTLGIARGGVGLSQKQARKKRQALLMTAAAVADPTRLQPHLWGLHGQERQLALRKDDATPLVSTGRQDQRLNDKQIHAQEKRRKKKGLDKITAAKLERQETKRLEAAVAAVQAADILQTSQTGLLETETDMERTTSLKQVDLRRLVPEAARHQFELRLPQTAPYGLEYDRSGRYALLHGHKGHVALMDCRHRSLMMEYYVHETVRDACFLHNFSLHAVAQKNHVFIYDQQGTETHRLSDHNDPMALQFLPYHWLLASIGRAGWLKYQDTSTGELVSKHATNLGACRVLRQNPANAVLHAGHSNGTVTLWSPASSRYLAKLLCHKGAAITSLAIHPDGSTMVTGGMDRRVRIWDLRMMRLLHSYNTVAGVPSSLDISQQGLLAIGHAGHATFWSQDALRTKVKDPYMHHSLAGRGPVETLRFRPFEDVVGIGHAKGVASIVVPGAGEPNVDTSEYLVNPSLDAKQRREQEVRALLDKLPPDSIALDPDQVGGIEGSNDHLRLERARDLQEAANSSARERAAKRQKTKKRGRSKIQTKLRRKQQNVVDESMIKLREAREEEKRAAERGDDNKLSNAEAPTDSAPISLKRFFNSA